jgi:hypothetical protein
MTFLIGPGAPLHLQDRGGPHAHAEGHRDHARKRARRESRSGQGRATPTSLGQESVELLRAVAQTADKPAGENLSAATELVER